MTPISHPLKSINLQIFNASTSRWRQHLRGAADLIRFRGGSTDLHPVIKRNLFMLDLQSALNVGEGFYFESEEWMEIEIENKTRELDSRPDWAISLVEGGRREACVIDPLLGTSVKLLSVMVFVPLLSLISLISHEMRFLLISQIPQSRLQLIHPPYILSPHLTYPPSPYFPH